MYSDWGVSLSATTGMHRLTVLLVQTGHDVAHLGPDDGNREYSVGCFVTSKTSRVLPLLSATKGTHRGVQSNQQTGHAHAMAANDDERAGMNICTTCIMWALTTLSKNWGVSASRQEDNDRDELELRKIRSFMQSEYHERRFLNELQLWER